MQPLVASHSRHRQRHCCYSSFFTYKGKVYGGYNGQTNKQTNKRRRRMDRDIRFARFSAKKKQTRTLFLVRTPHRRLSVFQSNQGKTDRTNKDGPKMEEHQTNLFFVRPLIFRNEVYGTNEKLWAESALENGSVRTNQAVGKRSVTPTAFFFAAHKKTGLHTRSYASRVKHTQTCTLVCILSSFIVESSVQIASTTSPLLFASFIIA
jgi:hypothetical protein